MSELEEKILEKIGSGEKSASSLHIRGYGDSEISQALLTLELTDKIELVRFETLVREDGGLVSIGRYRKKQRSS